MDEKNSEKETSSASEVESTTRDDKVTEESKDFEAMSPA